LRHLQGADQGQHRQDRHRYGRGPEPDRRRAGEDELPLRGRGRQGVTRLRFRQTAEALAIPVGALLAAMVVFGLFMAALRQSPLEVYALIYRGGFASALAWQNTLARAAPPVLPALCVARA